MPKAKAESKFGKNGNKKKKKKQENGKDPKTATAPDHIARNAFDPKGVELTQKIDIDYQKVAEDSSPGRSLLARIKFATGTDKNSTLTSGKSLFSRKPVTDDYVKSSTVISTINSIPPLKDKLELQDINDNYELREQFSEGAQGIIRTAFDKSLKRDIVVKSLKTDEDEHLARKDESLFVSEARIMAQLDHPSIIPLYGLHCELDSKLHLAMKHIHGKTLKKYLEDIVMLYEREGAVNFDEKRSTANRIEYFLKVCEAVDYAHCKGVIHRDLKPENIMIGNYGEVYVMDWGLACLIDSTHFADDEHTTEVGSQSKNALVGTPYYIAPELIRGGECSPQSDIFSLGMILFELITLEKAVPGKTVNEVLKNIVHGVYRPFKHRFLKGRLSPDLRAIVAKAICESLDQRYKTARDMAKDLKLYLMSEETAARPDNIFRKFMRAMVNHKMLTFTIVLIVLLFLSIATIHSLYTRNQMMIKQEMREDMLASFQNQTSEQAVRMEKVFYYFNTQLDAVAYLASQALESKVDKSIKIYRLGNFHGSSPPRDYALSPAYGIKISLDYPVLKKAETGSKLDLIDEKTAKLTPLFRHMMFTSSPEFKDMKAAAIRETIMDKGAPLNWITLGMKNGTMFAYPGTNCYPDNYDPRTRPWYKKALTGKSESVW
jgi:serine/threonine protein kinase